MKHDRTEEVWPGYEEAPTSGIGDSAYDPDENISDVDDSVIPVWETEDEYSER